MSIGGGPLLQTTCIFTHFQTKAPAQPAPFTQQAATGPAGLASENRDARGVQDSRSAQDSRQQQDPRQHPGDMQHTKPFASQPASKVMLLAGKLPFISTFSHKVVTMNVKVHSYLLNFRWQMPEMGEVLLKTPIEQQSSRHHRRYPENL